jgi:zinc and cadmium transporter
MNTFIYILISTFLISAGALAGILTLALQAEKLNKILLMLVSLSAGALMGGAFIHLLPEASQELDSSALYGMVLFSFIAFFFVEKLFHWRHCHKGQCQVHTFGYMNLCGDAVHNFIDGLILAAAFITDIHLGIVTTLAIALHEIPQEIGDFGVLLYAGFEKRKAMIANFSVALTVVLGGIVGFFLSSLDSFVAYLLPFAAGGFIYIAASDLMPEIRKEQGLKKSLASFGVFLIGVLIMYLVTFLEHE